MSRVRSVAMKRSVLALALVAVTVLGFVTFHVGNAGAWKCDKHPEQPTCTTLPPETTSTTPPFVPSTTGTTPPSVPDTSTTTSTTVPVELAPPVSIVRAPTPPRFAG